MPSSPTPLKRLIIARHGETKWSSSGQHTGRTDIDLTPQGRDQAEKLGAALKAYTFDKAFSSSLKRQHDTCCLAGLQDLVEIDEDLLEWNYGSYEGRTSADIHKEDPGWSVFKDGSPGGESIMEIQQRADRFLSKILAIPGQVAVFSSGHMSRVLAARWLGLSAAEGRLFALSTGSLSVLGYERDVRVVQTWNNTSHLAHPLHS